MPISIVGHLKINEVGNPTPVVDVTNAIHPGNLNAVIANALIGSSSAWISFMAFGNNASVINGSTITYKPPRVGPVENPSASLYNTTFIKRLSNLGNSLVDNDNTAVVPGGQTGNQYTDIVITCLLDYTGPTGQDPIDQATTTNGQFTFDEIAIYSGDESLLSSDTSDSTEINNFIGASSSRMLTHVRFHPVQKAANVAYEISYTLRIKVN